jgi:TP901 family phage tail tape measure protein
MAGGVLRIAIVGDASKLSGELDKVGGKVGGLASTAVKAGAVISAALTTAAVGVGKAFADFDEKMTQSTSIMGDVSDKMRNEMSNAAMKVAETTKFSANEAAEAFYFLASAGLSAEQSIAAMPAVAQFATAGNFDLALATDLLTDAQSALGLSSKDAAENLKNMTRVSDVLVQASVLANASVQQFSEALTKDGAGALVQYNKSMEEGVAILAEFANKGLKGSEAGTLLKNTLIGLDVWGRKNTAEFAKFGVTVYDTAGAMRPTADIIADMEKGLGGLSTEARNAALQTMGFNDDQRRGIIMLMGSSDALRVYQKSLEGATGATKEIATKQMDTFNSQFAVGKHLVKDFAIVAGSFFMPAVTAMLTKINNFGSTAREKFSAFRQSVEDIVGGAEGMKDFGNVLSAVMQVIRGEVGSFNLSGFIDGLIQSVVNAIPMMGGAALRLFTAIAEAAPRILPQLVSNILSLVSKLIIAVLTAIPSIIEAGVALLEGLIQGIVAALPKLLTFVQTVLPKVIETLVAAIPRIIEAGVGLIQALVTGLVQSLPILVATIASAIPQILTAIINAIPLLLEAGIKIILALVDGIVQAVPQLLITVVQLIPKLLTQIVSALPMILEAGAKVILALVDGIITVLPKLLEVIITDVIPTIIDGVVGVLPQIIDTGIKVLTSLITGIVNAIPKLVESIIKLIPLIVTLIVDNLPKIMKAGIDILFALIDGLVTSGPQLQAAMWKLVWELVKLIPKLVPMMIEGGADLIWGLIKGIGNMAGHLASKLVGTVKNAWGSVLNFLGISSPSKEGMKAGEWLMIGFQNGIDSIGLSMPAIPALMADVDQTITRNLRAGDVDYGSSAPSFSPEPGAPGRGTSQPVIVVNLEGGLKPLVSAIRVAVDEDAGGSAEEFFSRR